jgi:endonuclease/exonuclease/phosphatase family metal-dependent hydrolase
LGWHKGLLTTSTTTLLPPPPPPPAVESEEEEVLVDTIVCGDMNQPRERDYLPNEWANLIAARERRGEAADDGVGGAFQSAGFTCSWDQVADTAAAAAAASVDTNWGGGAGHPPPFTHWTGTNIDHTYSTVGLKVRGVYVVHTPLSDHLPVITDWEL